MPRRLFLAPALLAAGVVLSAQVALAPTSLAAANPTDQSFATKNEQTNLAEITIGQLALQRATSTAVKDLATKTIADHKSAQSKLQTLAKSLNISLPTAPNAQQQSQAAQLKSVSSTDFDSTYLQIQLAGHQLSIADTNTEITGGSDTGIVSYAKGYLPVAQMHLNMTQQDLAALGLPTGAPAGSGGQARTGQRTDTTEAMVLGGVAVLLIGGGVLLFGTRRPQWARSR